MNDKNIKLIALDLDGTTLNEYGMLSQRTVETFRCAMEENIHIVICTGRTFASLPKELFAIDGLEYIVTSNGAKITRLADMKTIYENHIPKASVQQIGSLLKQQSYSVEIFTKGKAYIALEEYEEYRLHGSSFRDVNYVLQTRNPIPDFFEFLEQHSGEIENINISFPLLEQREHIKSILQPIENITLTSSFLHNIEIGGATTSKAEALRFLMGMLEVTPAQLMAVGDSYNDLEMIRYAGMGVAMDNSPEDVKKEADYVTDTNERDGVAKAIERFAL